MNRFVRAFFPGLLAFAGVLCGHFLTAQQLVWAVWAFPAIALAFYFADMQLTKKNHV